MASLLLVNVPILPSKSIKSTSSIVNSPQPSIKEDYSTPRTSVAINQTSPDCSSSSAGYSSLEITDTESTIEPPVVRRRSRTEIKVKIKNDEAEFFACPPAKNSRRKRDRIRAKFSRNLDRSESTASETSGTDWNDMLTKTLTSMQNDLEHIIDGFDQLDQSQSDPTSSNPSGTDQIRPHLSFHERQYEKLQLVRLTQMLHPPNLLTCEIKECPYPYTDIVEPRNFKHLRATTGTPDENLYVQCKPIQHRKCRYRTQRGLIRMKDDLRKIRRNIRGENPDKSSQRISSLDVVEYRHRLEKTLLEFRQKLIECDQLNRQENMCETMSKNIRRHAKIKTQMDDYRMKSKTVDCTTARTTNELISTPYIPPRRRNHRNVLTKTENPDRLIDNRFDPTTFVNVPAEMEEFFGQDLPFWDVPLNRRLSIALSLDRQASPHFSLTPTVSLWDRFVLSFKTKQKLLHTVQSNQRRRSTHDAEEIFFDCSSPKKSQSLTDLESVDF